MSYLDDSLAKLTEFEGSVPWMYLDTVGLVTVGVGNMLPDATEAIALPFKLSTGDLAISLNVVAEFLRVKAMEPGRSSQFYRVDSSLVLDDADIQTLLLKQVQGFEDELRTLFPGYDAYPDPAKLGLIDMIYNLGMEGLRTGYPKFGMYVRFGNWIAASLQCHRRGPSDARNAWAAEQFNLAARTG